MDGVQSLPIWLEYCKALATPAIAVLAAVIAYGQWRTANRKIAYDLFDRRFAALTRMQQSISDYRSTTTPTEEVVAEAVNAVRGMRYLFGSDVDTYMELVATSLKIDFWHKYGIEGRKTPKAMEDAPDPETIELIFDKLLDDESIFEKYLRLSQYVA